MKTMKGGEKATEDLLERWPIQGWCQALFINHGKCDAIDNNMCETFNGVMVEARSKPIITLMEEIRRYVMNRIVAKREYATKWKVDFGPNIVAKIEKERNKSGKWQVEWNGAASDEVFWYDPELHVRESYDVKLARKSCTCEKWDKTRIPCQHAMAAVAFHGENPFSYVSDWFTEETYLNSYQFTVNPVRSRMFWPTSEQGPLLPPLHKRMPGRPPKKRRREPLEGKNGSNTKLSRKGRIFKCGVCHVEGHNKRCCPKKNDQVSSL